MDLSNPPARPRPVAWCLALSLCLLGAPAAGAGAKDAGADLKQRLADRLAKGDEPLRLSPAAARRAGQGKATAKPSPAVVPAKPPAPWGYTGEGAPERWGELDPANRLCAIGTRQMPIDLRDTLKVDLEPIQFDYAPALFAVRDTGRTLQVDWPGGSSIRVRHRQFELQSIQFRRPAEERLHGKTFDMSAQLLHKSADGQWAVVSLLLQKGDTAHPALQRLWTHIPLEKSQVERASLPLDLSTLLPAQRGYFITMGSLTTPPCTEGVLWMTLKEPITVDANQLAVFEKLYPMNARPLQPAAGRIVQESL